MSTSHEDKVERMNHLAFFFFMGALLIGFVVVALAAFLYWSPRPEASLRAPPQIWCGCTGRRREVGRNHGPQAPARIIPAATMRLGETESTSQNQLEV